MAWTTLSAGWRNIIGGFGPIVDLPTRLATPAESSAYGALTDTFEVTERTALCVEIEAVRGRIGMFITDAECSAALSRKVAVMGERAWLPLYALPGVCRLIICNFDDPGVEGSFIIRRSEIAAGDSLGRQEDSDMVERHMRLLTVAQHPRLKAERAQVIA